jgi:acyl dehydratase
MSVDATPQETSKPLVITGLDDLRERAGTELGVSDWTEVKQENINTFAKLTGDEQYIHVDPERAAQGPFGTTIQHGFLTLGMSTGLLWSIAPLKVGARFRMRVELAEVNELKGGAEAVYRLTYEVADEPKPCCVADLVFRYYS